jgi:transposase-like protein
MTPEQIRHARDLLTRPENTVVSIAKLLGVSRNTIYKYVPELKEGCPALAGAATTASAQPTPPSRTNRTRSRGSRAARITIRQKF